MYLHVGEDFTIKTADIIAIIDKKSLNTSPLMNEFLDYHKQRVINVANKKFKSIVITLDNVYFSPFSSGTLRKRSTVLSQQEC